MKIRARIRKDEVITSLHHTQPRDASATCPSLMERIPKSLPRTPLRPNLMPPIGPKILTVMIGIWTRNLRHSAFEFRHSHTPTSTAPALNPSACIAR